MTVSYVKSHLLFVPLMNSNLMIGTSQIKLGKNVKPDLANQGIHQSKKIEINS